MIQILRLRDGFDVISDTSKHGNGNVDLTNPMIFHLRNSSMVLEHWLPLPIMKGNSVTISMSEVICEMEPNEDFLDYYLKMTNKLESAMEAMAGEENNIKEMALAMEELESNKQIKFH